MAETSIEQILTSKAVSVQTETTAEQAIATVMEFTPSGGSVYYVYVIDDDDLVGVVSMRELLNAANDERIATLMTSDPVSVSTSNSVQDAAHRFKEAQFTVLPVVDENQEYVGIVRATDVIRALDEKTSKELLTSSWPWI